MRRRTVASAIEGSMSFIEINAAPYRFFQSARGFGAELILAVAKKP
jgi:hypothetical protein